MNVIGLDLSLTAPGLAVADRTETLRTDAKRGDKRFCDIRDWLMHYVSGQYVAGRSMDLAMIEAVPPYDVASSSLERIHGIAREVLARYDVPFAYVNVTALKSFATSNGKADKSEVMDYVETETGKRPADDNQADAWVLHRMGLVFLGESGVTWQGLTSTQMKAFDGITWPLNPGNPTWPRPYGELRRKPMTKKCRHRIVCLKNGDHWLHPFTVAVCDKPPK